MTTKGPWMVATTNSGDLAVFGPVAAHRGEGQAIALILDVDELDENSVEQKANARLIAEAPEMLDFIKNEFAALALWRTANLPDEVDLGVTISMDKASRIIERIEGEVKR